MTYKKKDILNQRIREFIKYDFNLYKFPLVVLGWTYIYLLILIGKKQEAFKVTSHIFRTGWMGSFQLGNHFVKLLLAKKGRNVLIEKYISELPILKNTEKFFSNPSKLLGGVVLILKAPKKNEKGVLIIKYSYYFPLFLKFFNLKELQKRYHIVLEPSWAGYCELSILAYGLFEAPVFLMTYEPRDRKFIEKTGLNLIPVDIGPSWFVNYNDFTSPASGIERDIDIIMVSSWAKFKRHAQLFKCLQDFKFKRKSLNVTLVGYPADLSKKDILNMAQYYGVESSITIYEKITSIEVAKLYKRSKINILWSKFEGNNRSIVEGMLCDTPAIMREGHNYGEKYDFINSETGYFANEKNLAETIDKMLIKWGQYSPRNYILSHRSCDLATEIMNETIKDWDLRNGYEWTEGLVTKINELNAMEYVDEKNHERFKCYYDELIGFIC